MRIVRGRWKSRCAASSPTRRRSRRSCSTGSTALDQPGYGYNAATREYGDLLEMGVIDPGQGRRGWRCRTPASIASLILTVDCMIANAPKKQAAAAPGRDEQPEMY